MSAASQEIDPDPAGFLQLAANPLRWRMLGELAGRDLTVQDLTRRVGEAQNLVSYHLARLRSGGLVFARRSAADRRDTYYGLDLEQVGRRLTSVGGALHPGLRFAMPPRVPASAGGARVLFLCTGNSARSPMAAALAGLRSNQTLKARSAGSSPRPVHPNAVRVMQEDYGVDLSHHRPTRLDELADQSFDQVISLCDRVREVCPEFPGAPTTRHWSLVNPVSAAADEVTYPAFRQAAAELETRIDFLIAELAEHRTGP